MEPEHPGDLWTLADLKRLVQENGDQQRRYPLDQEDLDKLVSAGANDGHQIPDAPFWFVRSFFEHRASGEADNYLLEKYRHFLGKVSTHLEYAPNGTPGPDPELAARINEFLKVPELRHHRWNSDLDVLDYLIAIFREHLQDMGDLYSVSHFRPEKKTEIERVLYRMEEYRRLNLDDDQWPALWQEIGAVLPSMWD